MVLQTANTRRCDLNSLLNLAFNACRFTERKHTSCNLLDGCGTREQCFVRPGCTFPLFLFLFVSGSARTNASNPTQPRPIRADQRGPSEWPLLSVRIHLVIAAGRALSDVPVREPVHAAQQYHGHREHLRAGGSFALQRRGVGEKHPFLSRPADHRPGVPSQADVERVVCA